MLARVVMASFWVGLVSATVICPDGNPCPETNTCCLTKKGYGCCIYPSAVCCSNELHCCPAGYQCSDASQSCVKDGLPWFRLPWHRNTPAMTSPKATPPQIPLLHDSNSNTIQEKPSDVSVVHCDNIYTCPDGTTCCRGPYGAWSCCKYTVGSCCRDGINCCPYGYQCDITSSHCLKGGLRIAASPQQPALRSDELQVLSKERNTALVKLSPPASPSTTQKSWSNADVVNCDSTYYCPHSTACCKSPYGTWSCCRATLGSCCRDGKHCCPHGYQCDITSSHCMMGSLRISATPQLPALRYDEHQEDPCCLSEAGCCQVGFHCDRGLRVCVSDFAGPVPWATLIQAPGDGNLATWSGVIRCDGRFYCPAGNSCCKTSPGEWGCCPYTLGICCEDGKHCCEYRSKCSKCSQGCVQGNTIIPSSSMRAIQRL